MVYDVEADDRIWALPAAERGENGERLAKLPQDKPLSRCVADVSLKSVALLKRYGIQLETGVAYPRTPQRRLCLLCLCRLAAGAGRLSFRPLRFITAALINETGGA
ncbi:MAG: hypothetical protein ACLSA6_09945 [Holdemania massiliensis]